MIYSELSQVKAMRDRITNSRMGFMDKVRNLAEVSRDLKENKPETESSSFTLGKLLHGAVGAGMGVGIAKGVSKEFNLDPSFSTKLQVASAGLGALMNMGLLKISEEVEKDINQMKTAADQLDKERHHAFRFGFMKGICDSGYFEKTSAVLPIPVLTLDPTQLASIPRSIAKGIGGVGRLGGSLVGSADVPDETDEEITKLQVEQALLEEQLERLKNERHNRALKQLLAKRRKGR